MSAARPRIRPSLSNAARTSYRCWWPWNEAVRFSLRSSTQATGRRSRIAAPATTTSSRPITHLSPNPPPTSGAMTRTRLSAIPSACAMPDLTWCGTCVDTRATSWSSRSSHSATQARPSSGSAVTRALVNTPPTVTGAEAKMPGSDSSSNMVRSTMQLPVSS